MGTPQKKIILSLVLLTAAGLLLVRYGRSTGIHTETLAMNAACIGCDWSGYVSLDERPARCPECRQRKVWPALQCANCGHVQAIDLVRFNGERREPYCTACPEGGPLRRIE